MGRVHGEGRKKGRRKKNTPYPGSRKNAYRKIAPANTFAFEAERAPLMRGVQRTTVSGTKKICDPDRGKETWEEAKTRFTKKIAGRKGARRFANIGNTSR